ncbi:MAG: RNA methyltransferase [Nitrospira sp.]|nr:RNA methyltransferase [Nitrospira sp.]
MKKWKDNVYFILVEPMEAGNIGAAARAIKNMDFKNLLLINPPEVTGKEAGWFAHGASDVLEAAVSYKTLKEAISDKSYIVGTTQRTGRKRGGYLPVDQGSTRLFEIAQSNKVAILFGREDRGLYNEEVEQCGFMMTIPTGKAQPSLNLAQAVLIIAYEVSMSGRKKRPPSEKLIPGFLPADSPSFVSHEQMALLFNRMEKSMALINYLPENNDYLYNKIMNKMKNCLGRSGLSEWEYNMFHGICDRIEKKFE